MMELNGKLQTTPLDVVLVGGGFGGIGMAIELKKQHFEHFVVLEKGDDVGGVWRDNTYPGAACDVPSHLYSFSFEPKPDWSHTFSRQPEILDYLRHCADKYQVRDHFRFNTEVASAQFNEELDLWQINTTCGETLWARTFITAMGQLSRPIVPKLTGMETFTGQCFHSARWDHSVELLGKRVAVVGTGASAIQFVPEVAKRADKLKVFQRSPSYIMPRPDREYSEKEKSLNNRMPWIMKLRRLAIYLEYESRALAFTRFKKLLAFGVGRPFRKLLNEQIKDASLNKALTPDYPIGCKRILLSGNYYPAMAKENVQLVTEGIKRVYEYGIETTDGRRHEADVIIYGTGFAATEFLSPLNITGLNGQDLNHAWQQGAKAHLGMSVPGFPNFFMLYGPNTNLGHNSIVYMLESQIRYLSRTLRKQRQVHATRVEVDAGLYQRFNQNIQAALGRTAWNGCKSWYIDENGHNSTGWPGFTLTYRWLTRVSRLNEFAMTGQIHPDLPAETKATVYKPVDAIDQALANVFRMVLRLSFKPFFGKPFSIGFQRRWTTVLSSILPARSGVFNYQTNLAGIPTRVTVPREGEKQGAILFLHGGAFCVGSPWTHRPLTSHLAFESGLPVYAIDYALVPEHPYPACINDALRSYEALLRLGYAANKIVVMGDSAGGGLTMALAIKLRELGLPMPAGLAPISPMLDHQKSGKSWTTREQSDCMIRTGWTEQSGQWLQIPPNTPEFEVLKQDLHGLPDMLIQVGDQEVLLSDSLQLATKAQAQGVNCQLEIYDQRWHVFHLQSFFMSSAAKALKRLAVFASTQVENQAAANHPVEQVNERKVA